MKKTLWMTMLVCGIVTANAQTKFRCSFSGPTVAPIEAESETDQEMFHEDLVDDVFEEILEEIGLNSDNFWAYPATNVRNFQAEYDEEEDEFKMFYSFNFLKNLDQKLESKWDLVFAIYVISAHEVGHHLNGDVHGMGSSPDKELMADYFAGKTAARHGIPYNSAIRVYQLCTSVGETSTHPGRDERIEVFTEGYQAGK